MNYILTLDSCSPVLSSLAGQYMTGTHLQTLVFWNVYFFRFSFLLVVYLTVAAGLAVLGEYLFFFINSGAVIFIAFLFHTWKIPTYNIWLAVCLTVAACLNS